MQKGRPEYNTLIIIVAGLLSIPVVFLLTRWFGYLGTAAGSSVVNIVRGFALIALFAHFSGQKMRAVFAPRKEDILRLPRVFRRNAERILLQRIS